jgi:hypothetical protein
MIHPEFKLGEEFICGGTLWVVTDIGSRTVVAIPAKEDWMNGPPYAQAECVFDENDLPGCEKVNDGPKI